MTVRLTLAPKSARETAADMVQLVLPNDTNTRGNVLGGTVMHWIDIVAAITAHRHAGRICVTASMDDLSFEAPIKMGQLAHLSARVTFTSKHSIEVQVDVEAEEPEHRRPSPDEHRVPDLRRHRRGGAPRSRAAAAGRSRGRS